MNNHLTEDQVSKCVIGLSSSEEQQHLRECIECSADVDRFRETLLLFGAAVRDSADRHVVSAAPRRRDQPRWAWALATVAVIALLVAIIPTYKHQNVPAAAVELPKAATNEDVLLMEAVNAHLSRILPSPMEPVMALLPKQETATVQGDVQ